MEDEEINIKKELFQNEIVNKEYNIDEFTEYVQQKTGNENIDFTNWSIDDMKIIINNFQNYKLQLNNNNNNNENEIQKNENEKIENEKQNENQIEIINEKEEDNEKNIEEQINTINNKLKKKEEQHEKIIKNKNYHSNKNLSQLKLKSEEEIKTKIANNYKLHSINQDIFITGFEKENGIFTTNYLFKIEINDFKTTVKRNFNDFVWLKKTLEKFYPNTFIPPLPKMPFFKSYTDDFINKKMRYLNKFLTSLSHNLLISSTNIFYEFLTSEKIDKLKEDCAATEAPSSYKKMYTINGVLDISTGKNKDDLAEKIFYSIKKQDNCFKNLNLSLKELINEFDIISKKMKNVSNAFKHLANNFEENKLAANAFKNYEKITNIWSNFYNKQKITFKHDFKEFFKFYYRYSNDFLQFYNEYNDAKYQFVTKYVNYENYEDLGKKEEKDLNKLRKKYGFTLNRLISEYEQLQNIIIINIKNQILTLDENHLLFFKELSECLAVLKDGINQIPKNKIVDSRRNSVKLVMPQM